MNCTSQRPPNISAPVRPISFQGVKWMPKPLSQIDLLVHHARGASSTPVTLLRRISQATPRRSARPTQARCRLLYLDTPAARSRWFTGTLTLR